MPPGRSAYATAKNAQIGLLAVGHKNSPGSTGEAAPGANATSDVSAGVVDNTV